MKALRIATSETGPHHSWTVDHLLSIPSLPLDALETLSIIRVVHPFDSHEDDVASLQPVSREILDKLKEESSSSITDLDVDWWGWSPSDIKELLASNRQLERLSITLDAPLSKMLSLSNVFANMHQLRVLRVRVPEKHAPGVPFQQYHLPKRPASTSSSDDLVGLITPASSPMTSARAMRRPSSSPLAKPSSLPTGSQASPFQTPPATPSDAFSNLSISFTPVSPVTSMSMSTTSDSGQIPAPVKGSDPSFPNPRDLQKFARRCPKLERLEWYGRNGRGSWSITRESSATSATLPALTPAVSAGSVPVNVAGGKEASTVTVKVEHVHPCFPPPDILQRAAREKEADVYRWEPTVPRQGQEWTGPAADTWRAEQEQEREEAVQAAATATACSTIVEAVEGVASASANVVTLAAPTNKPRSHKKSKSSSVMGSLSKIDTGDHIQLGTGLGGAPPSRKRSPPANASSPITSPTKNQNSQLGSGHKKSQDGSATGQGRRASVANGFDSGSNGWGAYGGAQNQQNSKRRASGANGSLKVDVTPSALVSPSRPSATSPTATRGPGGAQRTSANSLGGGMKTKQTNSNGRSGGGSVTRRNTKSTPV